MTHLGEGVATPAPSLDCDRPCKHRPADSLGRSKFNGVRVNLFRPTVDLPGLNKIKSSVSRDENFISSGDMKLYINYLKNYSCYFHNRVILLISEGVQK